jgi:hemerythrin
MTTVNDIWNEKFNVGIDLIDEHHKTLLGLILDLQRSLRSERINHKVIKDTLNELSSYTRYHFTAEEKLMKKFDYPEFDAHVKEHQKFIEEVEWLIVKYEQNQQDINIEMLNFLKEWLVKHILVSDKGYSSLLEGKV